MKDNEFDQIIETEETVKYSNLKTIYRYDENGYFCGEGIAQVEEGTEEILLPPRSSLVQPENFDGYWYKINSDKATWTAEKKPTTPEECLQYIVKHNDITDRAHEIRSIIKAFADNSSGEYQEYRDPKTLSLSLVKTPIKTFETLKEEKMQELTRIAGQYDQYKCDTMYLISSVKGLKINADARSQNNIRSLIEHYSEPVIFKTFDNKYERLEIAELETMIKEAVLNGESLYQQKWKLQQVISQAQNKEELDKIALELFMGNFTQGELLLDQ